jgi:hypothetical protein
MEQTSELIDRIVQLERQQAEVRRVNRRLELLAGALALLFGSALVMGQTTAVHSVEARQFVLRDNAGIVRGAMGIGDNGAVGINLNDIKGRPRISLDIASNGTPGLDFYDAAGKLRATFALGPEGTPGLGLYDPSGKLRTSLDIPAPQTPGLAFYHPNGKPAWGAP